jgi:hypothetical protein
LSSATALRISSSVALSLDSCCAVSSLMTTSANDRDQRAAGVDNELTENRTTAAPLHPMGTPGMGVILSGESPVCETGSLKEDSIPNERSDWQSTR